MNQRIYFRRIHVSSLNSCLLKRKFVFDFWRRAATAAYLDGNRVVSPLYPFRVFGLFSMRLPHYFPLKLQNFEQCMVDLQFITQITPKGPLVNNYRSTLMLDSFLGL